MNIAINRLDPSVPDPVESRRRAAGRMVRLAYASVVFGLLGFLVIYFGRPLVYLGGPGVVSSSRYTISFPYVVQVNQMNVVPGDTVKAGDEIGQVRSPQQDNTIATYMRSLADIAGRSAELRIKVRVAQQTLAVARSYLHEAEAAAALVGNLSSPSTSFRLEVLRESASARKAVVSQEAEIAEGTAQLAVLDDVGQQIRARLDESERTFAGGRVSTPVAGIVSTNPARAGQSLMAGTPIAEVLDTRDVFVDWYIPNERLIDPVVGTRVIVVFGNWRLSGTIREILPVSDVYAGSQSSIARERIATQIARIRFDAGTEPPALNSTVHVHMYYSTVVARIAAVLIRVFGIGWGDDK